MSGWPVIQSGWSVFMDGKDTMLIGETTPFAMIVSELMLTVILRQCVTNTIGIFNPVMASRKKPLRRKIKTNNIDRARFRFCLASRCLGLGGTGYGRAGLKLALPVIVGNVAESLHGFFINFDVVNSGQGIDNPKPCREALFQKAAQAHFRPKETCCFESGRLQRKSEAPSVKRTALLKGVF